MNGTITVTGQIAGALHNHVVNAIDPQTGNRQLADHVPTADDVGAMYTWFTNGQMIDPTVFPQTVITPTNAWILRLSDTTIFKNWAANHISNQSQLNQFQSALNTAAYNYWNADFLDWDTAKELALLDILSGSGVTLSKANLNNLNTWKTETKSSKSIISTPCN